jgi:hypothetical protein
MISDPQIMAPVVDKAGRSTLTWSSWWTQVQAALNGFVGAFTIGNNNAVTITNPAALQFGDGWTNWTPTISPTGSMTISGVSVVDAQFLRIGPKITFKCIIDCTFGGTVSGGVNVSLPVAAVGQPSMVIATVFQGAWFSCGGQVSGGNAGVFTTGTGTNFLAGTAAVFASGSYRCV